MVQEANVFTSINHDCLSVLSCAAGCRQMNTSMLASGTSTRDYRPEPSWSRSQYTTAAHSISNTAAARVEATPTTQTSISTPTTGYRSQAWLVR
jgi:hypothetical protein